MCTYLVVGSLPGSFFVSTMAWFVCVSLISGASLFAVAVCSGQAVLFLILFEYSNDGKYWLKLETFVGLNRGDLLNVDQMRDFESREGLLLFLRIFNFNI